MVMRYIYIYTHVNLHACSASMYWAPYPCSSWQVAEAEEAVAEAVAAEASKTSEARVLGG